MDYKSSRHFASKDVCVCNICMGYVDMYIYSHKCEHKYKRLYLIGLRKINLQNKDSQSVLVYTKC